MHNQSGQLRVQANLSIESICVEVEDTSACTNGESRLQFTVYIYL